MQDPSFDEPASAAALLPADTFRFACTRCGECCFDQRVALEPRDVHALAEAQGVTPAELFARGTVALRCDDGVWDCLLSFAPWPGRGRRCRFLQPELDADGRWQRFGCALHDRPEKPLVCRLSPLARARHDDRFFLVAPVAGCPGMDRGTPRVVAEAVAPLAERLAWSTWYQHELWPQISRSESLTRWAFGLDDRPHCV